jgi:hypothetical protein
MEIAVFWLLSMMAMSSEIETANTNIELLQAEVITLQIQNDIVFDTLEDHEKNIINTAAAHSAFYAAQQLKNEEYEESINLLDQKVDTLKEMSEGESSAIMPNVPDKP